MLKNYFKIAWRNLWKNKLYSSINIFGLAIGLAVSMLIGLWVYDELSYNKYHQNYDHIAQVLQQGTANGEIWTGTSLPYPLADALRTNYGSSFTHVLTALGAKDHILSAGEKKISKKGEFIEAAAPEMLGLKMLQGTWSALNDPNSVLLSESTANALFGDVNPMGEVVRINNNMDARVTGVYEDLPHNTSFHEVEFFAPWDLYVSANPFIKTRQWGDNFLNVYVEIQPNVNFEEVSRKIKDVHLRNVSYDKGLSGYNYQLFLHPMSKWHLRSEWENGVNSGGLIRFVKLFGIIGAFVLLLACINFMNLSTARSEKRAGEVGIRKAVGSVRGQLIKQFFSESLLVVLLAFIIAIILLAISFPWFSRLAGKEMTMPWGNPYFWLISLGFVFLTGLLAGSYPAVYLSSFQPIKVLKGSFRTGRFASIPRKVLVVLQFTVSVILIIGTILVYRQIQFAKNRPVGYDRDGLIMIQMKSPDFYGKYDLLRTELKNTGMVSEMAQSASEVTNIWSNNGGFYWKGKDPAIQDNFGTLSVTHEYGKTVGWQFVDGRDFSRDYASDSTGLVVNQAAVEYMGLEDPVDETIRWDDMGTNYHIIGVIKDMVMESPFEPAKPTVFFVKYALYNWINIKINPAVSAREALPKIEEVFRKLIPSAPFDYKFADQEYALKFAAEERIGKLAGFFSILAIFISCLGLFGLASFVAEQRTKEIGIRKVLGATIFSVWRLLSRDFLILVILSCVIAIPIAAYFLGQWLEKYEYRTEMSWWIFAVSALAAMLITLLTVSFQSIKAALMNPVKSLRSE